MKRQAKVKWLQTHLWYAKRFHMLKQWGWKLPNYATDKSRKSSINALKKEVIMMVGKFIRFYAFIPHLFSLPPLGHFFPSYFGNHFKRAKRAQFAVGKIYTSQTW